MYLFIFSLLYLALIFRVDPNLEFLMFSNSLYFSPPFFKIWKIEMDYISDLT